MLVEFNAKFSDLNSGNDSFLAPEDDGIYEVCIANINPKERRKRLRFGITQFVVSLVVLSALLILGADKILRLPLFFLFGAAAAGFFQWRDKT
ncbi:MAG: hypothetical protein JNM02_02540 [Anaerolineales bacterium]|nr:hypothetical protein [Anaerolineales bacterium]